MKNKSKIKIGDLSAKVENFQTLKTLSDRETVQVVGGGKSYDSISYTSPFSAIVRAINECPPMTARKKNP